MHGKRYVDMVAAFGVASLGHNHPAVVRAVKDQAGRLLHAMADVFPGENRARLMERLGELLPGFKFMVFNSGSEAVESALKAAYAYTGKSRFISFTGSYHGLSLGALVVTGRQDFRKPFSALVAPVTHFASYPYCFRCPRGLAYPDCEIACLEEVEALLEKHKNRVAAVIIEPIQARGGVIPTPPGYLRRLEELCHCYGALLILDEIYTGMRKTGPWFAYQAESLPACPLDGQAGQGLSSQGGQGLPDDGLPDQSLPLPKARASREISPDIVTFGKALGGGVPISVAAGRPEIMDAIGTNAYGESLHCSTFMGNPLATAAAQASLEELGKLQRIPNLGPFLERLKGAGIGDRRGRGSLWGLELVTPDGRPDTWRAQRVVRMLLDTGIIVGAGGPHCNVLTFSPPLIITDDVLTQVFETLQDVLRRV